MMNADERWALTMPAIRRVNHMSIDREELLLVVVVNARAQHPAFGISILAFDSVAGS